MLETLPILPVAFWIALLVLVAGFLWGVTRLRQGVGLPVLAVLFTTAAWHIGDVLYNDYEENHLEKFTPQVLDNAWLQVALFLAAFLLLTPVLHQRINKRYLKERSRIFQLLRAGIGDANFQAQIERMFYGVLAVWVILVFVVFVRIGTEIPYYFFPFLGYKADPWGRGRVGGQFDALVSLGGYFQIFVAMMFGLVASLTKKRWIVVVASIACCLTWPYYIFDRVRNLLLAVTLPALLSWVFLRYRGNLVKKLLILGACFLAMETWMAFILANRDIDSVAVAFNRKGLTFNNKKEVHHDGLNIYEELCWINTFLEDGTYTPNMGQRYFAELVNPIPRGLWPGKPYIGIDYSIARGAAKGEDGEAGVTTSISTGMIGQGVVNFGRLFGPPAAAFLFALWVAILARLDLTGEQFGRIPLLAFGLILTFNLGRDITFITLYSFVFGWFVIRMLDRTRSKLAQKAAQKAAKAPAVRPSLGNIPRPLAQNGN